jgi:putative membrane protein
MLAFGIAAISWQGYAQLGFLRWAALTAALLVVMLAGAVVSWLVTGYQVVGRELRIWEGLIWRRNRAIPLERLQAVDLVRPLLARLAGVAELRLEVVGGDKSEAPLAYLEVEEAGRLREYLLRLARGDAEPAAGVAVETEPAQRLLHATDNRDVLVSQLLTPYALSLPLAMALTVVPVIGEWRWTFAGVGSALTAVIGVIQVPTRRILDYWHFRLGADRAGLRLHHGLLGTRSQTVPTWRIQAIGVTWPLLWRPRGWLHSRVDVAGYGEGESEKRTVVLLPVADLPTTRRVVGEVLGVDITALPLVPAPARARWLAPLRQPSLAIGTTDEFVATRNGWLARRLTVVPLARIQSVRGVQGPLQRWLGLATVHVDTAGGLSAVGHHREAAEAYAVAGVLAAASRAARARAAAAIAATATATATDARSTHAATATDARSTHAAHGPA